MSNINPTPEMMLEHYKINIDLYKQYLKLSIKFNLFFYAITGAILSYYLAHSSDSLIIYSLFIPILMSMSFGIFFFWASSKVKISRTDVENICKSLGFKAFPEINVLAILLKIFGILLIVVSIAITVLFVFSFIKY